MPQSAPARQKMRLANGEYVDFVDGWTFVGGELGAMDIIEASRAPSILRTTEGLFGCWLDGNSVALEDTEENAKAMMLHLLHPEMPEPPHGDPVGERLRAAGSKHEQDVHATRLSLDADQVRMVNDRACFYTDEPDGRYRFWSADRLFPISIALFARSPFYDFNRIDNLLMNWGIPHSIIISCEHLRIAARHDPAAADFTFGDRDYRAFLKARGVDVTGSRTIGEQGQELQVQEYSWKTDSGERRQSLCWLRHDEEFWRVSWDPENYPIEPLVSSWRWLGEEFFASLAISPRILESRNEADLEQIRQSACL